jgi:hypothetical protein
MTRYDCPYEQDVLDALTSRRWPARCDDGMRHHVASCTVCADLVEVACALLDESDGERTAPVVPHASMVWWRAQLRAREDAARAAARPLHAALQVAVACVAAAALFGLIASAPAIWSWVPDVRVWVPDVRSWVPAVDAGAAGEAVLAALANRGVQLAAAAWLVLGPVAVYLAFTDDR